MQTTLEHALPLSMHPTTFVPHPTSICVLVHAVQVDQACSDLQMAALSALQPISSELKAAIFNMASIPVGPMAWESKG